MKQITNINNTGCAQPEVSNPGSNPPCPHTIVVGLGNDILSDDGVGLYVARRLRDRLDPARFTVTELTVGGMGLVDHLLGYERAVVIDAVRTGRRPPGTLTEHSAEHFANSRRLASYHCLAFPDALGLARRIGASLPEGLRVFAIEVEDVETVSERCTPAIEACIETVVDRIARLLESA